MIYKYVNIIMDNKEYYQRFGQKIMKEELNNLIKENNTPRYYDNIFRDPYKFNGVDDDSKPFGYIHSLLKDTYIAKERLKNII